MTDTPRTIEHMLESFTQPGTDIDRELILVLVMGIRLWTSNEGNRILVERKQGRIPKGLTVLAKMHTYYSVLRALALYIEATYGQKNDSSEWDDPFWWDLFQQCNATAYVIDETKHRFHQPIQ